MSEHWRQIVIGRKVTLSVVSSLQEKSNSYLVWSITTEGVTDSSTLLLPRLSLLYKLFLVSVMCLVLFSWCDVLCSLQRVDPGTYLVREVASGEFSPNVRRFDRLCERMQEYYADYTPTHVVSTDFRPGVVSNRHVSCVQSSTFVDILLSRKLHTVAYCSWQLNFVHTVCKRSTINFTHCGQK